MATKKTDAGTHNTDFLIDYYSEMVDSPETLKPIWLNKATRRLSKKSEGGSIMVYKHSHGTTPSIHEFIDEVMGSVLEVSEW